MKNELMKQESGAMTIHTGSGDNTFEGDASDVLIPKLLIGQAISEVVQRSMVKNGEIYKSTTKKALGGNGAPFPFIPLTMKKEWSLYESVNGKWTYRGTEPFTSENASAEWEWDDAGVKKKRVQAMNFYVLLPDEIDKDLAMRKQVEETGELPDLDDALLPAVISFQSTSFAIGKILSTHFAKASDFNVPGYTNFFLLDSELVKGDKGIFGKFQISPGGKTKKEHILSCKKWKDIVSGNVRVDEEESIETRQNHGQMSEIDDQF